MPTQHVAPNNVAICCVGMLWSFGRGFTMKIDSVQITSVRKAGLTLSEFLTRNTEMCPLSVLPGVRIKWVNFRENVRTKLKIENWNLKIGVYSRFGHVTCLDQSRASEEIWWNLLHKEVYILSRCLKVFESDLHIKRVSVLIGCP